MLEVYTVQVILKLHKNDEQLQAHFELILYFIEEFYLSKGINYSKFNFTYSYSWATCAAVSVKLGLMDENIM